jgi:hypothetical protein
METLIWFGVVVVIGAFVWMAEPYHTRMIEKAHARLAAEDRETLA